MPTRKPSGGSTPSPGSDPTESGRWRWSGLAGRARRLRPLLLPTLALLAVVSYGRWVEPSGLTVRQIDVPVKELPADLEGYRILVASDLHSTWFGRGQAGVEAALARLERRSPTGKAFDAAVFAGDLTDVHRTSLEPGKAFLGLLTRRAPTYFAIGNHDVLCPDDVGGAAAEVGAVVLMGDPPVDISRAAAPVLFVGAETWRPTPDDLTARVLYARVVASRAGQDSPLIVVVVHSPSRRLARAAREAGARLVVAGHDHGGQVALPVVGPVWSPTWGWLPGRISGLFDVGGMPHYVSAGLGTSVLRVRFLVPPELTILRLVPASGAS